MNKERQELKDRLNECSKDMKTEDRVKVEKLIFDLYHSKKAAEKMLEEEKAKSAPEVQRLKNRIAELIDSLDAHQDEIESLRNELKSAKFHVKNDQEVINNIKLELKKSKTMTVAVDNLYNNTDSITHLIKNMIKDKLKRGGLEKMLIKFNEAARMFFIKFSANVYRLDMVEHFQKITHEEIMFLTHLGFSELHFCKFMAEYGKKELAYPVELTVDGKPLEQFDIAKIYVKPNSKTCKLDILEEMADDDSSAVS